MAIAAAQLAQSRLLCGVMRWLKGYEILEFEYACDSLLSQQFKFLRHNIEKSCKSRMRPATMMTTMPTTLNSLFAVFLPTSVNSIEPTVDTKTINDTEETLFSNVGKYDEKIFTFSACEADGFEENV